MSICCIWPQVCKKSPHWVQVQPCKISGTLLSLTLPLLQNKSHRKHYLLGIFANSNSRYHHLQLLIDLVPLSRPHSVIFFNSYYSLCMSDLTLHMYRHYMHAVPKESRRVPGPLELESWMAMNHHVSAENQTLVFCKSSKRSYTVSHLSSPSLSVFKNKKANGLLLITTSTSLLSWKTVLNTLLLKFEALGKHLLMIHVLLKVIRNITIDSVLILALGILYIFLYFLEKPIPHLCN